MTSQSGMLAQAKFLGVAGSILLLLAWTPAPGVVLAVVGFLLILIAVRRISDAVGERSIYTNMTYAAVFGIIGAISVAVVIFGSMSAMMGAFGNIGNFGTPSQPAAMPSFETFLPFISSIIIGLVVIWILFLIAAIFLRKSFNQIASRLDVSVFSTAALLFLIGAALKIVLVGFAIVFIAEVVMIVAFASIDEQSFASKPKDAGEKS